MDMNDIIVVDEDDEELEEGEIADDEVPVVEVVVEPEAKLKQLPRRYSLKDKDSNNKHKNCKRKDKNKFHNPSKLETFHRKKHKTSCPRRSSENNRLKRKDVHHSHNSFAVKSAFKNYTSPPRVPPLPKQAISNNRNSGSEVNFQNFLSACKRAKERITQRIKNAENIADNTSQNNESVSDSNDSRKANISLEKQEFTDTLPLIDLTEDKNEDESDEEDVEELRRIALATCAKKQQIIKVNDSLNEILKPCSSNLPSPNQVLVDENDNDSQDNYEVVDMDLDEEENSCQIKNDSLFVIDKIPAITEFSSQPINNHISQNIHSPKSPEKSANNLQSNHSLPIDDFEEQLLRAEVIASMNSTRQKSQSPNFINPVEEKVSEIITKVDMLHNSLSTLHSEIKSKPCTMYSKGPLQNYVRQPPKRIIGAKSKFIRFKNNKTIAAPPPPRGVNTVQERLIITLNNDTSTDESEEEKDENVASQNVPIESIEALISNARQKSDAAKINNESSVNVSCLSKAQQEEYNSLKKLLAQKSQYSLAANTVEGKNSTDRSHVNLLVKKISVAKANLEKEKGIKIQIEKELLEKKKSYLVSKLKVQMLKEKLHAAEKIRAANLEKWKQFSAKLDILGKSVAKRELLLKSLETDLNTNSVCIDLNATKPPVLK